MRAKFRSGCQDSRDRATIEARSQWCGSLPKERFGSPSSRKATDASAGAVIEPRTNSAASVAVAIWAGIWRAQGPLSHMSDSSTSRAAMAKSSRRSTPHAGCGSGRRAATVSGGRCGTRRTSRQITLPEPSQISLSGASRRRRGIDCSSMRPCRGGIRRIPPRKPGAGIGDNRVRHLITDVRSAPAM